MRALLTLLLLFSLLAVSGCASFKASPYMSTALGFGGIPPEDLKDQYANEESEFLPIRGLEVHYRDVGEGPVIILVHGILSSLQTWDGWVEELSKNYRVITLDVPGYGLTGGPEDLDDFTIDYVYGVFENFIQYMEADHFTLVGNSFGGYLSARYATDHPDKVDRLILIDPSGYPGSSRPFVFKMASWPVVGSIMKVFQPPFLITRSLRNIYGDESKLTQDNLYRYVRMAERDGAKPLYVKTLQMIMENEESENQRGFAGVQAPTLLMWGEEDPWIPLAQSEKWMADLRDVKLITYPGVGHVPMEEIPFQTVSDALTFLADAPGAEAIRRKREDGIDSGGGSDLESLIQGGGDIEEISEEELKRLDEQIQ